MNMYEEILQAFSHHKVEYLIVGGIAVTLHGVDRTTKDLDIWINMSRIIWYEWRKLLKNWALVMRV